MRSVRLLLITVVCNVAAGTVLAESPYAGQQHREIKALSAQQVENYLAGAGMGFAKAAELNRYPGPKHVMELADELQLSDEQREQTQAIFERMSAAAQALGRELVDLEQELDQAFAQNSIDPEGLGELTDAIGQRQAAIRRTHLGAHLEQRAILEDEQIERYIALRGYGTGRHNKKH